MSKNTQAFIYSGPLSGATLRDGTEVMLHPGHAVRLDPDDDYTRTLIERGHIAPVPQPQKASVGKSSIPTT